MRSHVGRVAVLAVLCVAPVSCGPKPAAATFTTARFQQTKATTEQQIVAELGPGEEVRNSYTESVIREHGLPAVARFLRWEDPDQPGIYYHVVIVDGKLLPKQYVWDSRPK